KVFLENRKAQLILCVWNSHVLFLSAPIGVGLSLVDAYYNFDPEKAKECPRVLESIAAIAFFALLWSFLVIVLTWKPRTLSGFSTRSLEIIVTVESLFVMALFVATSKVQAAKMQGVDPELCYRRKEGT
ncbi:unnamed protein product, partial [Polarella glacialis]